MKRSHRILSLTLAGVTGISSLIYSQPARAGDFWGNFAGSAIGSMFGSMVGNSSRQNNNKPRNEQEQRLEGIQQFMLQNGLQKTACQFGVVAIRLDLSNQICAIPTAQYPSGSYRLDQTTFQILPIQTASRESSSQVSNATQNQLMANNLLLIQNGLQPTVCNAGVVAIWLDRATQVCAVPNYQYPSGTYYLDANTYQIISNVSRPPIYPSQPTYPTRVPTATYPYPSQPTYLPSATPNPYPSQPSITPNVQSISN